MPDNAALDLSKQQSPPTGRAGQVGTTAMEVLLLASLFGILTWSIAPGVNEAHYLCKAKHFWNPEFCPDDIFLASANAHWLFLFVAGWFTQFLSLESLAWAGRIVCWLFVAWGWQRLASCVTECSWRIVLSGGLLVVLNQQGHLAGEWLVGGFESKPIAYGFVFWAIASLLRQRIVLGMCFLGLAICVHALVGIWATAAIVLAVPLAGLWRANRFDWKSLPVKQLLMGMAGLLLLAAVGVVPALNMNSRVDAELLRQAYDIQVFERLAHHQYLFEFSYWRWFSFALLLAAWLIVGFDSKALHSRPYRFVLGVSIGSLLIAVVGAACSIVGESSILRFYLFRLADVMVPVGISLGIFGMLKARFNDSTGWIRSLMIACLLLFVLAHSAVQIFDGRSGSDRQSLTTYADNPRRTFETWKNWKRVCEWVRSNTSSDQAFLTPPYQQTFKWYAERSEIVNWKDAPQDAEGLLEWKDRIELSRSLASTGYGWLYLTDQELSKIAQGYSARYLVVEQSAVDLRELDNDPVSFRMIYPADPQSRTTYVVFDLRDSDTRDSETPTSD